MKIKYLFLSVLFVFMAWGFISCKDDDVEEVPVELAIDGTQTAFEFSAMGGEQKVVLKTNSPWGAEMSPIEDSSWVKLKISEKELLICPQPNWNTEVRSSKVKIFAGQGEKAKAIYVDVVQKAGDKMSIVFSPEKVIFSPAKETKEVLYMTVNPNVEYKWCGDTAVNWVNVQLDVEHTKFVLTSEFNKALNGRRAVLAVSGGVGNNRFTDTLAIEQMGNEPMIKTNPDTVRIGAIGGTVDVEILSTVEKYNVNSGTWARLTKNETDTTKYVLTVDTNPNTQERIDRLYIGTPYGVMPSVDCQLVVIQEANEPAKISAKDKVGFETAGGEEIVEVTSSWSNWEFKINEEDAKWCHVTKEEKGLKVVTDASNLERERTTVITLTVGDGSNIASCQVIVSQLGTKPSLVLSTNLVALNENGDEVIVDVVTNAKIWAPTLPSSEDKWCEVVPDFKNKQIKIKANPAEAGSRSVELIVEIPQTDVKVSLVITQSKFYKPGDLFVMNGKTLGIVYEVSDGGAHGKVVSLNCNRDLNIMYRFGLEYDEDYPDKGVGIVARSWDNGLENMRAYKQFDNWKTHFPVAAYVDDLNDENGFPGWYLPSIREVEALIGYIDGQILSPNGGTDGETLNEPTEEMKEKRKAFNQKLVDAGGKEFYFYGNDASFIIDNSNSWEADYFNRIYTSTESDYQLHPRVFIFYLRNGWWSEHPTYSEEAAWGEIRPFLAF